MPHETAARGYDREAVTYSRARPAYPARAVDELCAALGLSNGNRVVELGAGTGIFTRQLVTHGLDVTAVEPVAGMRRRLQDVLDPSRISAGSAEATGLPGGIADAVLAATAWHWFDAHQAIEETRRLLRPPGGLGLIWNEYDCSVPWVAEIAGISSRYRPADAPNASTGTWREFFFRLDGWLPLSESAFPNPRSTDPQGVLDRVVSSSAVAALPAVERAAVTAAVQDILARYGLNSQAVITLPYTTRCYWTRPIGAG